MGLWTLRCNPNLPGGILVLQCGSRNGLTAQRGVSPMLFGGFWKSGILGSLSAAPVWTVLG